MYLSHIVKGRQLIDCDAMSWCTERVKAVAKGLSKSKGFLRRTPNRFQGTALSVCQDLPFFRQVHSSRCHRLDFPGASGI